MAYKLNVTEHADELLDNLVYHLIYRLKNEQAAEHLLDSIDVIYDRLEVNPFQFSECRDAKVSQQCFDENTSCYNCLRNYYNQANHSKLKRKYACDFIEGLLRQIGC